MDQSSSILSITCACSSLKFDAVQLSTTQTTWSYSCEAQCMPSSIKSKFLQYFVMSCQATVCPVNWSLVQLCKAAIYWAPQFLYEILAVNKSSSMHSGSCSTLSFSAVGVIWQDDPTTKSPAEGSTAVAAYLRRLQFPSVTSVSACPQHLIMFIWFVFMDLGVSPLFLCLLEEVMASLFMSVQCLG